MKFRVLGRPSGINEIEKNISHFWKPDSVVLNLIFDYFRSPGPFIRSPDTFSTPQSAPATPMSQRRRLRINQSPKPPEEDNRPNYREHISGTHRVEQSYFHGRPLPIKEI